MCITASVIWNAYYIFPALYYIFSCGLSVCTIFSTLSHKEHIFQEKIYWTQNACMVLSANVIWKSYIYWTVHHRNGWKQKTNLMPLAILFHFLCAQHVWDINISIIRSLRMFCWITALVMCSWFELVLQPATRIPRQPSHTKTTTHIEPRTHDQCGNSTE